MSQSLVDLHNQAKRLMTEEAFAEAGAIFSTLALAVPDRAAPWFYAGQCAELMGDYHTAADAFREAVRAYKRTPGQRDRARAHFSLGANLFRLGHDGEAELEWRIGLNGKCDSPESKFVRSQVSLCLGDYVNGWVDYEHRRTLPGWSEGVAERVRLASLPPEWDGKSEGRVLVFGDQGAGDLIQFSRYLPLVAQRSRRAVHIETGGPLRTLLGATDSLPCDWSVPMCSLPYRLGIPEPIPPTGQHWTKPGNAKPRIGVCWKGSPHHTNDLDRSCHEIDVMSALQDERWELVSLQEGYDFKPKDYLETAELMGTLDAVFTVDTSCLHVAGTLGVPTVLIPPTAPEWRHGLRTSVHPWYPSVTTVRRKNVWEWAGAINRAKLQLVGML